MYLRGKASIFATNWTFVLVHYYAMGATSLKFVDSQRPGFRQISMMACTPRMIDYHTMKDVDQKSATRLTGRNCHYVCKHAEKKKKRKCKKKKKIR